MKPSSIVAIIVAAVIIIAGIVTCFVANGIAEKNGTPLFAESRGDDYINTIDLTDKEIIKISLNFTDADVNIYGSSTTSYIEFVNFRETFYSLSVSNTTVSFSEMPDFSSLLRFWENGFSFKGMRYLLNPRTYDDSRMKTVNIYLSSDCEIKQFEITANSATVSLENLSCPADYVMKADDIAVFASSVKTNSMLKIGAKNGADPAEIAKAELKSSSFESLAVNAENLALTSELTYVHTMKIAAESGSIDWAMPHLSSGQPMKNMKFDLAATGKLTLDGTEVKSPVKYDNTESAAEGEDIYSFDVSAGKSDVSFTAFPLSADSFTASETEDQPAEN